LVQRLLSELGNFDIPAEQKISFMNETKWYKILPALKGSVQKSFRLYFGLIKQKIKSHYHTYYVKCSVPLGESVCTQPAFLAKPNIHK
jgi:hypothetical protein